MKIRSKLTTAVLAHSIMATQTGCIGGIFFWPLFIPGTLIGTTGVVLTGVGFGTRQPGMGAAGVALLSVGLILDEKNPGHMDALNKIPKHIEVAKAADVTVNDIVAYNRNLPQIREKALTLSRKILEQRARKDLNLSNMANDSQINSLAKEYGFHDAYEMLETFKKNTLPAEQLKAFASSDPIKLDEAQAKILLFYGFGVKMKELTPARNI